MTLKYFYKLHWTELRVFRIFNYLHKQMESKSIQALRNIQLLRLLIRKKKKNPPKVFTVWGFCLLATVLKVYLVPTSYHKLWQSALFPRRNCCPHLKSNRKQLSVFVTLHRIVPTQKGFLHYRNLFSSLQNIFTAAYQKPVLAHSWKTKIKTKDLTKWRTAELCKQIVPYHV